MPRARSSNLYRSSLPPAGPRNKSGVTSYFVATVGRAGGVVAGVGVGASPRRRTPGSGSGTFVAGVAAGVGVAAAAAAAGAVAAASKGSESRTTEAAETVQPVTTPTPPVSPAPDTGESIPGRVVPFEELTGPTEAEKRQLDEDSDL